MLFDILGWIGMILVILAYGLLSSGKLKNGPLYQIINLASAICMIIALFPKDAWFSVALNVTLAAIAIFALIKLYRQGTKPPQQSPRKK